MQKAINVIALLSGIVAGANVALAGYLYFNRVAIFEDAKAKVTEAAVEAVTSALPGMVDGLMPDIPEVPSATGGVVPSVPGL
tara:strand:- start:115 stop:360 length:246 start_codon:yes stop_codon:yes gene_type:complete